jgi:hypothetical protein
MTPKQTAWALLATCCRQKVVCARCRKLGINVNTVAFLEAAVRLLEKSDLPWPIVSMTKLLHGIVRNKPEIIERFPEEMRSDVALLVWRTELEHRRHEPIGVVMNDFSSLAAEAGVDEMSLQNLIAHIRATCAQHEVDARQEDRRAKKLTRKPLPPPDPTIETVVH